VVTEFQSLRDTNRRLDGDEVNVVVPIRAVTGMTPHP
jgi:hypothetical protein